MSIVTEAVDVANMSDFTDIPDVADLAEVADIEMETESIGNQENQEDVDDNAEVVVVDDKRCTLDVPARINTARFPVDRNYVMEFQMWTVAIGVALFRDELKLDFNIIDVDNDPLSFYKAVSMVLFKRQRQHTSVRKNTLCYMEHSHQRYQKYIDGDLKQYISEKRNSSPAVSSMEIQAACEYYRRPIFVFMYNLEHLKDSKRPIIARMMFTKDPSLDESDPHAQVKDKYLHRGIIYLACHPLGHFSALVPKPVVQPPSPVPESDDD